jgi:secretion/DNA translocation related TadE-like protein
VTGAGRGDRGFATVWVVTAIALVVVVATAAIAYGVATVDRHRAAAAADAVALAVALRAIDGDVAACAAAERLAGLDGAEIVSCRLDDADAIVAVSVALPGLLSRLGPATAQARAGPVSEGPGVSPSTRR